MHQALIFPFLDPKIVNFHYTEHLWPHGATRWCSQSMHLCLTRPPMLHSRTSLLQMLGKVTSFRLFSVSKWVRGGG